MRANRLMLAALLATIAVCTSAQADRGVHITRPTDAGQRRIADALAERIVAEGGYPAAEAEDADCRLIFAEQLDRSRFAVLRDFVTSGGRLVLIVGPYSRQTGPAARLLEPLGARLSPQATRREAPALVSHPLTAGLSFPSPEPARIALGGDAAPLASQGPATIAGWLQAGEGAVVVLPLTLLATEPADDGLTLAVRACLWEPASAAELPARPAAAARPAPDRPARVPATRLPEEALDFSGAVLFDSRATGDRWDQINPALTAAVQRLGLPVRALAIGDAPDPLVRALGTAPALVVLGSWRQFAESERVALEHYVFGGGRVFVAGGAIQLQARLADINTFIGPLGGAITMRRPRGQVTAEESLGRLTGLPTVPPGNRVVGAVTPLATVGRDTVAGALTVGDGAVVIMDVTPLAQTPDYARVVDAALRWLVDYAPGRAAEPR